MPDEDSADYCPVHSEHCECYLNHDGPCCHCGAEEVVDPIPGEEEEFSLMKLPEWTEGVKKHFQSEGFEVEEYQGFPLVKMPAALKDSTRLLKLAGPVGFHPVEKRLYKEGMLCVPVGSPA